MIGLKQRNALSRLLFIIIEKVILRVLGDNWAIDIGTNKINILGFIDDFIIGNDKQSITKNTAILINEVKVIGLAVNGNNTKIMELLTTNHHTGNVVI